MAWLHRSFLSKLNGVEADCGPRIISFAFVRNVRRSQKGAETSDNLPINTVLFTPKFDQHTS